MKRPTRNLFQSILCPVDFSAHSRAALQHAATLARRSQARLRILFVNDPLLAAAAEASQRTLARTTAAALRAFVTKAVDVAAVPVAYEVALGDPATEIVKRARRGAADLERRRLSAGSLHAVSPGEGRRTGARSRRSIDSALGAGGAGLSL